MRNSEIFFRWTLTFLVMGFVAALIIAITGQGDPQDVLKGRFLVALYVFGGLSGFTFFITIISLIWE